MKVESKIEGQISDIKRLRDWAIMVIQDCDDALNNIDSPNDDCDVPEVEAELFLKNAKEHFTQGDTYSKVITCSDEVCAFCNLEKGTIYRD
jgi:hypothetical protein